MKVKDLAANPKNPRRITDAKLAQLAKSMREFGDLSGIVFNLSTGNVVGGHQRTKNLDTDATVTIIKDYDRITRTGTKAEGYVEQDGERFAYRAVCWSHEKEMAANIAANKGAGEWDVDQLGEWIRELSSFDIDYDMDLTMFDAEELGQFALPGEEDEKNVGALAAAFIVPPFSVLDTKQGYWQDRRRAWLEKTGNLTESKEKVLSGSTLMASINGGSSNFDPVLAEIMYHWFNVPGGHILDPFGGEQTKGVVAGELGYRYTGVEFRKEQVAINKKATARYDGVEYFCGDSNRLAKIVPKAKYDFCLTSPPYYDLEVYSDADMSALPSYSEFMKQYRGIFAQVYDLLRPNAFLAVKVGEIRDSKTGVYRNFVGDNIACFTSIGFQYYNEFTLLNSVGTGQLRAARYMNGGRKIVKLHQNVLVFYKGDVSKISSRYPDIKLPEELDDGADDE